MNLKFNVLSQKTVPVMKYNNNMLLLFDTGASTPVWCSGGNRFRRKFPSAKKMNYKFLLTGFGRSEEELISFLRNPNSAEVKNYFADVYSIPEFILKTEEGQIVWKDLNVAVTDRRFSGMHMILPYTMFSGMKLNFNQNMINNEIIIESPKSTKYTFVKLNNKFSEKILQYIYAQDGLKQNSTKTINAF